jgi:hypothetical protein
MRNISEKTLKRKSNHTFLFSIPPPPPNRAIYKAVWENMVEPGRPRKTLWGMRIACRLTKATDTHSECLGLIAFARQQRLHERAPMLSLCYVACFVSDA